MIKRLKGLKSDSVPYSTLIQAYGALGNFDGCLNVFEEMEALGVKPNLVIYNILLEAMEELKGPGRQKSFTRK